MRIMIAGPPASGKLTVAVQLAARLSEKGDSVLVIMPDIEMPALPVLFPGAGRDSLSSLGQALTEPEPSPEGILRATVTRKGQSRIGFLGYKAGENANSYPPLPPSKAEAFMEEVGRLSSHWITVAAAGTLSAAAMAKAEKQLFVLRADWKSLSYALSCGQGDKDVLIVNQPGRVPDLGAETVRQYFPGNTLFTLPYCRGAAEAALQGKLCEYRGNRRWEKGMTDILNAVLSEEVSRGGK